MSASAATLPTIFTFQNGKPHPVRVLADDEGEPVFHAGDLCELLEYSNPHDAVRRHVEKDDLVKREVIDRLSRAQQANFVREPGMWSLLLGSHAPNAKKVKRWITAEVMPTIRKTGRYELPQQQAVELMSNQDMINLSRLVWLGTANLPYESAWTQGVWKHLRRVTNTPSPQRFRVSDIPLMVVEMDKLIAVRHRFWDLILAASSQVAKRVFHRGQDADAVIADITAQMQQEVGERAERLIPLRRTWETKDLAALVNRETTDQHQYRSVEKIGP